MKYKEALAWLYSLQRFGIKLGLENIRRLVTELDVDLGGARVIHVAGTNGKGSVCAMIDSICRAGKYRTGLFTSPHLVTFRERIRVNGEMISENEVATGLTKLRNLVSDWNPHPTFFEITTALALKHFSDLKPARRSLGEGRIDIVILETGLGGRLDATNAIQSDVAVITPIALDHEKWLGDSLEKVAVEKAGIIIPRTPVVSAPQLPEAEKVIRARAAECEAPLQFVQQPYSKSPVALRGEFQKLNAATAIAAIRTAKIGIDDVAIAHGLALVEWPARFQCWDKRTVIDGAHNPAATKVLVGAWHEIFGDERATLILAILSDKDLRGICDALLPISASVLLPKIRTERATAPEELATVISRSAPPLHHSITPSVHKALALARAKPNPILLTGSLHFAGEVLAHLRGEPAAFEECAQ
ncbi:MAG TPA: folylpolyglutamate synthase/dihydrofolate synthase family protein [Chthoniobacterales bacterium]|nr:folylpolyglutamate synthase/dihydrofolate synthase family protein [Chthoniobacterales bacterium]